jgi:hypothetical protein
MGTDTLKNSRARAITALPAEERPFLIIVHLFMILVPLQWFVQIDKGYLANT